MTKQTTKYYIGLSRLKGVGDVLAKTLIAYCGSAERVFEKSERYFEQIPGIGKTRAKQIASSRNNALKEAEREMEFIDKHQISVLCFGTEQYPQRLIEFDDAPMVLYYKGSEVLNTQRLITIVGTRNISAYGKGLVSDFVAELQTYNVVIVSGLAHGVDVHVHKKCIELGIPTIGVLAHGLDRLYPAIHTSIAKQMVQNGGLLTDYPSGTNPDKENFPKRNRIVAGMSDATLVIEAGKPGGALLTATLANGYYKEVFAVPGRIGDTYSEGTNWLIASNLAHLVSSAKDIAKHLDWGTKSISTSTQLELIPEMSKEEIKIVKYLHQEGSMHIDTLARYSGHSTSEFANILLVLELKGVIRTLPGKIISL